MQEQLTIIKPKPRGDGRVTAMITLDTHLILKGLSEETGISITQLIGKCVEFAASRVKIVPEE